MTSNIQELDDTPLLYEETIERYYLDKREFVGKLLPESKWHETNLEEVMPEDFVYNTDKATDTDDYEWKLSYQFTSDFRNPYLLYGKYGGDNMTFRRLYIILCEHFNMGSYFIDDYFETVYPYRLKEDIENQLEGAKEAYLSLVDEAGMNTRVKRDGTLDLRYKGNKELLNWDFAQEDADLMALRIKEDIKTCLATGIIPLNFSLSSDTLERRKELGISSNKEFFATGQLIDDLRIFFRLEKKTWVSNLGIQV